MCNAEECPGPYQDFRAQQCSKRNSYYTHQNSKHAWLPYEHHDGEWWQVLVAESPPLPEEAALVAITMAGLGARSARLAWCSSLTRPSVFSPRGVTSCVLSRCLLLISSSLLGKSAGSGAVNGRSRIQCMISLGFGWESGCAWGGQAEMGFYFQSP